MGKKLTQLIPTHGVGCQNRVSGLYVLVDASRNTR
jgi:hypothetical protein